MERQVSLGVVSRPAAGEQSFYVTLDVTVADATVRAVSAQTWGNQLLQTKDGSWWGSDSPVQLAKASHPA